MNPKSIVLWLLKVGLLTIAMFLSFTIAASIAGLGATSQPPGEASQFAICVMREYGDRNAAEITALSIAQEFRGRGLGRMLLRYAVRFAVSNRLHLVILSVNAENDSALGLYTSEGFVLVETVVCYARDCA